MPTSAPRVTIGMPVYNGAQFLEETLQSILAQTFTDFELIISDNASTDATADICKRYAAADSRIRYIAQESNIGAAPNYNFVLKEAHGEYFKWAAHDDLCLPAFIERCVSAMDADAQIVLAYPIVTHIDDHGKIIEVYDSRFHLMDDSPVQRLKGVFGAPPKCSPIFGLIRTDVLRKTGWMGAYVASDRVLLGELAVWGKLYEVNESLFHRRIHAGISTEAFGRTRALLASWFDPKNRGRAKAQAPDWQRLIEQIRGTHRAPIGFLQKLRCDGVVLRYFLKPRRIPYMTKELFRAGSVMVRNQVVRLRKLGRRNEPLQSAPPPPIS